MRSVLVMLPPKRADGSPTKGPLESAFLTLALPLGLDDENRKLKELEMTNDKDDILWNSRSLRGVFRRGWYDHRPAKPHLRSGARQWVVSGEG